MRLSTVSIVATAALAALLLAGGVSTPAAAVSPLSGDTMPVVMRGHVTDPSGKPIRGISVQAGCPCDSVADKYAFGTDRTSATGYYSLTVQKQYAKFITFDDRSRNYFSIGYYKEPLRPVSSGYVVNATMHHVSLVTGTITAVDGARAHFTVVKFYDTTTGKSRGSASAHSDGTYEGRIHPGSYKVRFGGDQYTNAVWYGGAATSAQSPTVTVGYGKTASGIDATVTPKPTISGRVTVDGKRPLGAVSERVSVTAVRADGTRVDTTTVYNTFSLTDLAAGSYTLQVRASNKKGTPFVEPLDRVVTIAPGTAIRGLVLKLTTTPVAAGSSRTTGIEFDQTSKGVARAGKVLRGTIVATSYGSVTGGKLLIYVNGTKVDSLVFPSSGRLNWSYRPAKVAVTGPHSFRVTAHYKGTATTRPHLAYLYAFGGD